MNAEVDGAKVYLLGDADRRLVADGPALIGPDGTRYDVPPLAFEALQQVESALRTGLAVKITPLRAELPVDEAADAIDMAADEFRSYVADGEIPFRTTEYVDWVRLADVLAFDRRMRAQRGAAWQDLLDEEPWPDESGPQS